MTFHAFAGSTVIMQILFGAALVIAAGNVIATLFAIFYQRYWYDKVRKPKFPKNYTPRCSIMVPCKGIPKDLGKNLEGFLDLDYPDFEVLYIVEVESDPAVPVIKSILARRRGNVRLVIAGLSSSCAQKNFNLLAGVREARDAGVYIFADSDIKPEPQWLKELILPLADPRISVTSGFRWLKITKGSFAEFTHAYINIFIYILFCCASSLGGVGLWGGSMAIRRKDFEELGVAKKWSAAVVDDMSLSQLVTKRRRKGLVVPPCITHTDDLIASIRGSTAWFERQIMFLKVYFKPLWFFLALPVALITVALMLLLPVSIVASLSDTKTFFGTGGGAALTYYIGELVAVSLYPLLGFLPRFYRFLLFQPIMRALQAVSYFSTFTKNTITWSGVRYHLKLFGDVSKVERKTIRQ